MCDFSCLTRTAWTTKGIWYSAPIGTLWLAWKIAPKSYSHVRSVRSFRDLILVFTFQGKGPILVFSDMIQMMLVSLSWWTWDHISSIDDSALGGGDDVSWPHQPWRRHRGWWWSTSTAYHPHWHKKILVDAEGLPRKSSTSLQLLYTFHVAVLHCQGIMTLRQ